MLNGVADSRESSSLSELSHPTHNIMCYKINVMHTTSTSGNELFEHPSYVCIACTVFAVIIGNVRVWNSTPVFTPRTCQDVAVCFRVSLRY